MKQNTTAMAHTHTHRGIEDMLALTAGLGLGAGAMYLCDPDRGRSRRSKLMGEAVGLLHRDENKLKKRGKDLLNKARGMVAEAVAALTPEEEATDQVLTERVRSRIGHVVPAPHDIQVHVRKSVVTLEGRLTHADRRRLIEEVEAISGVARVEDHLGPRTRFSPGLLIGLAAGFALFRKNGPLQSAPPKPAIRADQGC